ncbi:Cell shape-determining protein MreC [Candidatus Kinetoplastibacterium sorsogonicusi]|uniref:Cell shape-determining protein MreC n=1 Tax=Candidatus Kinetoplastidibacterium kentomonadis TaxID=1576550 RepID=A0A3Q8EXA4_9PROT|nr:rod shape-determining protein MreC [Candidatus Kinetoplastibacterium sorsogonicusi]AWD32736.1 Cell shape-determining protein MreC [Candidatus Kinetoplastibacterium sorsogonicusi]
MQIQRTPILFRRSISNEFKLLFLAFLSVLMMITDAGYNDGYVIPKLREYISLIIYPFQRTAFAPIDMVKKANDWLDAANLSRKENEILQKQRIELAQVLTHASQLESENAQLRRLLGIVDSTSETAIVVEVLYEPKNLSSKHLVFNKGRNAKIIPGMPVIDESGIVGQIIRVTNKTSEAALVSDNKISIPVQILRNGLRLIVSGSGFVNNMEVKYMAADADIEIGDILVTSGIGGIYPAGLSVAKITSVERNNSSGFLKAIASPLSNSNRYRHFLVLCVEQ